ncbi:hypothetical protein F5B17DRAFT_102214 [Nemania serpens]|nr:hypothetical protein F5B17DRAFT_102214 [Nemania serpens]
MRLSYFEAKYFHLQLGFPLNYYKTTALAASSCSHSQLPSLLITTPSSKMPWNWSFDVSSFLVLLSENEELGFRRASKRLSDVLSLAPVSGLQAYLRSYTALIDVQDRDYISPYWRKKAPLRNIRLAQMIARRGVLDDGCVAIYRIDNTT